MWWKLTGLALIEAALIAVMFAPIQTHAVKLDMPSGPPPPAAVTYIADQAISYVSLLMMALVFLVLAAPIWLAWRIMKNAKNNKTGGCDVQS